MGDRANIALKHNPGEGQPPQFIYLYSHWAGSELPSTLKSALLRGQSRWDDELYLNRIIFNEMTQGSEHETTGFGLGVFIGDGESRVIEVDTDDKTVTVRGSGKAWSFAEFIELNFDDEDHNEWEVASDAQNA